MMDMVMKINVMPYLFFFNPFHSSALCKLVLVAGVVFVFTLVVVCLRLATLWKMENGGGNGRGAGG